MLCTRCLLAIVILLGIGSVVAQKTSAQSDEIASLMKYQIEAKDPGMAALLAASTPFPGLGHYYAGDSGKAAGFWVFYGIGIATIAVGSNAETDRGKRNSLIGGLGIILATKVFESVSAYNSAVAYNRKLLGKYNLKLSFGEDRKAFSVAYRF